MTSERTNDDYFKIDVEMHLAKPLNHVMYFKGYQMYKEASSRLGKGLGGRRESPAWPQPGEERYGKFWESGGRESCPSPDELIELMDKYRVDMACLLPERMSVASDFTTVWSTNGEVADACEKYPERFIFQPNVGPLIHRGVKNAIWELEFLVKERNAKMVKFYPAEDTYINDPQLWPFYEKIIELNIPVSIHTGAGLLPFAKTKYCHPLLLEDVVADFPELKVIAFHFGWPYFHDLNLIAAAHPNVYIGINNTVVFAYSAPRRFAELIGEAVRYAGPDRIVWGTDAVFFAETRIRTSVEGLRDFQIPDEMQHDYGYNPLTEDDKKRIFGLNLAELLSVKPTRKIKV